MPNDYIKPYNLTENQIRIVHLCIQADEYVPMKGLDDNDVTRLFGYAFIRSPKTGYIAIAARGVAWYMDQVTAEQDVQPEAPAESAADTSLPERVQCGRKEKCLCGNDGWQSAIGFSKHSARKNGLQSWCKKCQNESMRVRPKAERDELPTQHGKVELPPPDGLLKQKPYWNCASLTKHVNRKHGTVYNHLQHGKFGAFRLLNTYAVYEKGFVAAVRYYQRRDEERTHVAQQALEFAEAVPSAAPAEIADALLPFIDAIIVQQKPTDAHAALELLVEAITCDFQRRANAHEMELDAYWNRFVPDSLRDAIALAQDYLADES